MKKLNEADKLYIQNTENWIKQQELMIQENESMNDAAFIQISIAKKLITLRHSQIEFTKLQIEQARQDVKNYLL